jgi:hypothetical protein
VISHNKTEKTKAWTIHIVRALVSFCFIMGYRIVRALVSFCFIMGYHIVRALVSF